MIGWKERQSAIAMRPVHEIHAGIRLRAESRPSGIDRTTPSAVARMAIWINSTMPCHISSSLEALEIGRPHPGEELAAVAEPAHEALGRDLQRGERIERVGRERDPRGAPAPMRRERDPSQILPAACVRAVIRASSRRRRSPGGGCPEAPTAGRRRRPLPRAMPMMRCAKRLASSTLWMLMITGMPRAPASSAIRLTISTEVFGSSDEVGSSASSSAGSCISARAMPTRWR